MFNAYSFGHNVVSLPLKSLPKGIGIKNEISEDIAFSNLYYMSTCLQEMCALFY